MLKVRRFRPQISRELRPQQLRLSQILNLHSCFLTFTLEILIAIHNSNWMEGHADANDIQLSNGNRCYVFITILKMIIIITWHIFTAVNRSISSAGPDDFLVGSHPLPCTGVTVVSTLTGVIESRFPASVLTEVTL